MGEAMVATSACFTQSMSIQHTILNGGLCVQMSNNWESSPRHMVRLDVRSLLQDAAIEEVWSSRRGPHEIIVLLSVTRLS